MWSGNSDKFCFSFQNPSVVLSEISQETNSWKILSVRGQYRKPLREPRIPGHSKNSKTQGSRTTRQSKSQNGDRCTTKASPKTQTPRKSTKAKALVRSNMPPFNKYQCQICFKCYSGNSGLYFHMATHTGKYVYNCNMCSMGYMKRLDFERHLESHRKVLQKFTENQQK